MLWLVTSVASSLLTANNAEVNRHFQQEGFRLNLWRTLLLTLFWAPLALIMPWPDDWRFYMAAVFGGLTMIMGNVVQADLSARHNGRVAIIHMPLKALLVYLMWVALDAEARAHLFASPQTTVIVMLCFAVMVLAMNAMRRNDASWEALRAVAPVVVLYAASDLFARLVLPHDQLAARLVVFLFLMTLVSSGMSLLAWRWRPRPDEPFHSPRMLQAASRAALLSGLNHVCFMIGLTQAPNPAYVSMVCMMAPVWLLVYHRLTGTRDDANPLAGTLMVVAAIILIAATL